MMFKKKVTIFSVLLYIFSPMGIYNFSSIIFNLIIYEDFRNTFKLVL